MDRRIRTDKMTHWCPKRKRITISLWSPLFFSSKFRSTIGVDVKLSPRPHTLTEMEKKVQEIEKKKDKERERVRNCKEKKHRGYHMGRYK